VFTEEMQKPVRVVAATELVEALGFDDFVLGEYAKLYSTLCLVTRDRSDAEDVMQEAFIKVWERWDRVRQMDSPAGYLYRTAFNVWGNRRRGAMRALKRAVGLAKVDDLSDVESRVEVVQALAGLSPRQRAAVVLIDLLGYPSAEAASILGVMAPTARSLASQGRAVLRRRIGEEDE
jgi:RNA polymerase sigma-70 factor, ECF subfamily